MFNISLRCISSARWKISVKSTIISKAGRRGQNCSTLSLRPGHWLICIPFCKNLTTCSPFFQINLTSASALLKLFLYLLLLSPSTCKMLIFALQHALFSFITAVVQLFLTLSLTLNEKSFRINPRSSILHHDWFDMWPQILHSAGNV